ncbi:potassium-transporting ATPase subunit KdpC [Kitasatospora sp. NA04385]|uniref:potassium-transporting ATPase subunit KdpC n=1 Tax=Kitasatospora sp. NA04385 TaxID=2742135 RepID=UPI001591A209|nr:potassium-transporting ATPase subunit KdpC [Kitasatospora sp. NA04385]QKW20335.1 potassium-transporting ATPase subunit KdpC [Kitasatospora sp. NA04385]
MPAFLRTHLTALRMLLVMTVILGIAYPLLVTGVSQLAFPARANGSLVEVDGRLVGSGLIGQRFDLPQSDPDAPARPDPKWFQPRPSAGGYDPTASGASNLGPNSDDLLKAVEERRAAVAAFDGVDPADVPPDALTASGSGLDPHISVAYAREQVDRVARERGIPAERLDQLIDRCTDGRSLGFLGQPGVNVLQLNRAVAAVK